MSKMILVAAVVVASATIAAMAPAQPVVGRVCTDLSYVETSAHRLWIEPPAAQFGTLMPLPPGVR